MSDTQKELKPVPDPSALTDAAIEKLRSLLMVHIDSLSKLTAKEFEHTKELVDERLRSIQTQFSERDARAKGHEDKTDGLAQRITRTEGHSSGVAVSWAVAVAIVGILMAFAAMFLHKG